MPQYEFILPKQLDRADLRAARGFFLRLPSLVSTLQTKDITFDQPGRHGKPREGSDIIAKMFKAYIEAWHLRRLPNPELDVASTGAIDTAAASIVKDYSITFALDENITEEEWQKLMRIPSVVFERSVGLSEYRIPEVINANVMSLLQGKQKTALLSLANQWSVGGGVCDCNAQEEDVFHRTNVTEKVPCNYPNNGSEAGLSRLGWVYAISGVQTLKEDGYVDAAVPACDMIFAAAPNFRHRNDKWHPAYACYQFKNFYDLANREEFKDAYISNIAVKIRLIIESALANKCSNLLLGALGCGAFDNNPYLVAAIFRLVLEEYAQRIKDGNLTVEFAIMENEATQQLGKIFRAVLAGTIEDAEKLLKKQYVLPIDGFAPLANLYQGRPDKRVVSLSVGRSYEDCLDYILQVFQPNDDLAKQYQHQDSVINILFPSGLQPEDCQAFRENQDLHAKFDKAIRIVYENVMRSSADMSRKAELFGKINLCAEKIYGQKNYVQNVVPELLGFPILCFYNNIGNRQYQITLTELCKLPDQSGGTPMRTGWTRFAFPTKAYSTMDPSAPVITDQVSNAFQGNDELKRKYLDLFKLILQKMFGLVLHDNGEITGEFHFLTDDNTGRFQILTRMLNSAKELGFDASYKGLSNFLLVDNILLNRHTPIKTIVILTEGFSKQPIKNIIRELIKSWATAWSASAGNTFFARGRAEQGQGILEILQNIPEDSILDSLHLPKDLQVAIDKTGVARVGDVASPLELLQQCKVELQQYQYAARTASVAIDSALAVSDANAASAAAQQS